MTFRIARALLSAAALTVPLAIMAAPAEAAGSPGWRLQAALTVPGRNVVLYSVAADGPGDAWTVGDAVTGNLSEPVVYHWDGRRWLRVQLPASVLRVFGPGQQLMVVGARSAGDVWAFDALGHWMRRSGTRWTAGSLPLARGGQAPAIHAVAVPGPGDVWAFGSGAVPYAAHFDGRRWRTTAVPGTTGITDASAVSPSDIWAVEEQDVLRWNGHQWRVAAAGSRLAAGFVLMSSVRALSSQSVWVGGGAENSAGGLTEAAAHWDGRSWRVAQLPAPPQSPQFELTSVVPDGRGGMWGLGTSPALGGWRLWHLTVAGWRAVPRPVSGSTGFSTLASDLAWQPRSASAWAAGWLNALPHQQGMILLAGA